MLVAKERMIRSKHDKHVIQSSGQIINKVKSALASMEDEKKKGFSIMLGY
ncbi:MAG: hypothetical protein QXS91_03445 [Candidatus Anstonellales archaeon]